MKTKRTVQTILLLSASISLFTSCFDYQTTKVRQAQDNSSDGGGGGGGNLSNNGGGGGSTNDTTPTTTTTATTGSGNTCYDLFKSTIVPIISSKTCTTCHLPGGIGGTSSFVVAAGVDASNWRTLYTGYLANSLVDVTNNDPSQSVLYAKGILGTSHSGQAAGAAYKTQFTNWIQAEVAGGCGDFTN